MYTRYDLMFEGETQDVGFMVGLVDTGMDEDEIDELLEPFDEGLPNPPVQGKVDSSTHFAAWYFTTTGEETFREAIQAICEAVHFRKNGWSVRKTVVTDVEPSDIVYKDAYQAAIRTAYTEKESLPV